MIYIVFYTFIAMINPCKEPGCLVLHPKVEHREQRFQMFQERDDAVEFAIGKEGHRILGVEIKQEINIQEAE